ncbi:YtxH domain-containing protein [Salibacterium salarium]|uniref:YtxH domain-containing protein n=1 Tax=Salibacterium salarium TaxID=284579 RepID=A0A428N3N8_9BACI|nr:YtxH domain-containing protein [Salibacterium salarium]RSL32919.1 YtxH domain-containing protein [Salibacterium salarium]
MSEMNTKDFVIGTLIGSIVGACSALLLAPKAGKELREDLSDGAQTAKVKTNEFTNEAYEKGSEWANRAKDKSSELAKNVSDQSYQIYDRVKGVAGSTNEEKTADELADELSEDLESDEETFEDVKEDVRDLHASASEDSDK